MNTSTDHKLNVNAPAGIVRGARAAALLRMEVPQSSPMDPSL